MSCQHFLYLPLLPDQSLRSRLNHSQPDQPLARPPFFSNSALIVGSLTLFINLQKTFFSSARPALRVMCGPQAGPAITVMRHPE